MTQSEPADAIKVALRVARALESVGIPYFLGGSLASSAQGEPRATNDVDMVIDASPLQVAALAKALGPDFEVDVEALADAVRRRGSWNIYFLPFIVKVDLFQRATGEFDQSEFERRRPFDVGEGQRLFIKSPEDSVLRKLLWYRQGGKWRRTSGESRGVLRVNATDLDRRYLEEWAARLGIESLLRRAVDDARGPSRSRRA
jgi:hypothetical protein